MNSVLELFISASNTWRRYKTPCCRTLSYRSPPPCPDMADGFLWEDNQAPSGTQYPLSSPLQEPFGIAGEPQNCRCSHHSSRCRSWLKAPHADGRSCRSPRCSARPSPFPARGPHAWAVSQMLQYSRKNIHTRLRSRLGTP